MITPNELSLVEIPLVKYLCDTLGYTYIHPKDHPTLRPDPGAVILKPILIAQLQALNNIDAGEASAIYSELAGLMDNAEWLARLRNKASRKLRGESTSSPVVLVDYDTPSNNHFAVTQQFKVKGSPSIIPDVVVFLNGVPVVVIEAKSPLNPAQTTYDAIVQMHGYEANGPRLFAPNLFNIATNNTTFRYGATGAPRQFWGDWRDPWPRAADAFVDATERGLYALLDKPRLLDIIAHFIVFETHDNVTIKKMCRHQQYRAVNKMVDRVIDGQARTGLIWHTQGSGKSLTMVFAALKLKFHRGIHSAELTNPNLLVLTDRVALHEQITKTFQAVGIQNVVSVAGIRRPTDAQGVPIHAKAGQTEKRYLLDEVVPGAKGKMVLSTIFKFQGDDPRLFSKDKAEVQAALADLAMPNSGRWILMIDECHRTQERDLGAYLRAMLPEARRFGFTGTPVKSADLNTFSNFSVGGEGYLDKYGIDDAIKDGATVPVKYLSRRTAWTLDAPKLDVAFDQTFLGVPDAVVEELKKRGVTKGDLARLTTRIDLIATDIWWHFKTHVRPEGYKAQVVAIDRLACVAYKRALDATITADLVRQGVPVDAAVAQAEAMSICVYSAAQHDAQKHPALHALQLDEAGTKQAIKDFNNPKSPLQFLIVCSKLLTGFDAPIEQAMYLDNPLRDHNLLQAIARTNRVHDSKPHGLIVDYIGVFKNLKETLSAYRADDVAHAATDYDGLAAELEAARRAVMDFIKPVALTGDPKADGHAVIAFIATEDRWLIFRGKAAAFVKAYGALMPDPRALPAKHDLKFIAVCVNLGRAHFDQKVEVDWKQYGQQVRALLEAHLTVTGLSTALKLYDLDDAIFWQEYDKVTDGQIDAQTAAVHKLAELQKITKEAAADNPAQFGPFSARVKALIKAFQAGMDALEALAESKTIAEGVQAEAAKHQASGLSKRAYAVATILAGFVETGDVEGPDAGAASSTSSGPKGLTQAQEVAKAIDEIYTHAPPGWHGMTQLKKTLRQRVALLVKPLGLSGWFEAVPQAVEAYAVAHYQGG